MYFKVAATQFIESLDVRRIAAHAKGYYVEVGDYGVCGQIAQSSFSRGQFETLIKASNACIQLVLLEVCDGFGIEDFWCSSPFLLERFQLAREVEAVEEQIIVEAVPCLIFLHDSQIFLCYVQVLLVFLLEAKIQQARQHQLDGLLG